MDHCSIQDFHHALRNPHLFATITPKEPSALCRTTHFAECRAEVDGREVLLHAPITAEAMRLARDAYALLRGERRALVGGFTILHNELGGQKSIVLEKIPEGVELDCAMQTISADRLLAGLREFAERLRRADISHNNLRTGNIIVDSSYHWHPLRLYYATEGYGNDSESIEALRNEIERVAPRENALHEPLSAYHTEYTPLLEGRRRITTTEGVGFVDENGDIVIEPRYAWASDFDEGRAMVMTRERKMGLIDTDGREIIAPRYEIVEYSNDLGNSWVRENGLWALFDYGGVQITEWEEREYVDYDIEL